MGQQGHRGAVGRNSRRGSRASTTTTSRIINTTSNNSSSQRVSSSPRMSANNSEDSHTPAESNSSNDNFLDRQQQLHATNKASSSSSSVSTAKAGGGGGGGGGYSPPQHDNDDDDNDHNHDHHAVHHHNNTIYESHEPWTRKALDAIQTFRYQCGMIVNKKRVQLFIVILIAINSIMMGIGTFDFVRNNPPVNSAFEIVDRTFLVIFTIELAMQFIYYGWRLLLDGWLVFDTVIIVTSWSFSQIQIIRAFRIFRALRLITRITVMKNLVLALFGVMPRMFAIGILLFLVSYIFAVMFTQLFKDLPLEDDYFGRLDQTFFTLFQIMTLDGWADIARDVMGFYSWAWLPFIIFVIITGFVVVNLIIAVICDAIAALHDEEKAKIHGTFEGDEDESDQIDESLDPALHEDVGKQLDALEDHVDELTRMQEETMQTLHTLLHHIQERRLASRQALST